MSGGTDDSKLIGVYSSRAAAEAAVIRLRAQPGFRELPSIVNTDADEDAGGFHIDQYRMDEDHWREGYITA